MNAEFALRTLIFLPVISFPFIYLLGRSSLRMSLTKDKMRNPARWLALAVMAVLLIPLTTVIIKFLQGESIQTMIGGIKLQMDGISILLSLVVVVMCFLVILFSGDYMKDEVGEEKYYALLVCMAGMVIGMVTTTDLFNLWIWFEAMAITPYVLVAFYHDRAPALEAGVKYLFQSAVGTMLVLVGIIIVYSQTGSLCITHECAAAIPMTPAIISAGVLFIIGFGVKSALVPMHTWLPDAHSQAPSGISAILSGVVIEAGLIAMLRALDLISGAFTQAGTFLIAFSVANILIGNIFALRQQQIKRMLAYSSISHMGYIVLGLGITMRFGVVNGAQGAFFHIFTHALMKGLAFMAVGALMHAYAKPKSDAHAPLMLDDLNGIAKRYPPLAFILTIALLSLAGLPPLAGFMSKWQIFVAGFETGNTTMIFIVIFAALNSVLSLAYYAPLINRMYRLKPSHLLSQAGKVTLTMNIVFYILTVLIILIGMFPNILEPFTAEAAHVILDAFVHP